MRVVIAEDEAIIRLDLKEILEEDGYEVVGETGRGDQAIELVRELRSRPRHPRHQDAGHGRPHRARTIAGERLAAVLILTAFSQRDLVEQARDAGALAYLVKPFQKSDLIPAIEMALGRHEQLVALERENADLAERLEARKLTDRAKGRLMDEHAMSEADSWRFLQKNAMDSRRKIHEVAADVVAGSALQAQTNPSVATESLGRRGIRSATLPKLLLLDGHSLAYRAFFALPTDLATKAGTITNAVYGFTSMLAKVLADEHPDHIAVAFDAPGGSTYRIELDPEYKAGRKETPDLFRSQLPLIHEVLECCGDPRARTPWRRGRRRARDVGDHGGR